MPFFAKTIILAVMLILSLYSPVEVLSRNKERDWHEGTLIDLQTSRDLVKYNYTGSANTFNNQNYSSQTSFSDASIQPQYRVYDTIKIEDAERTYLASRDLPWRWSKSPNLVINGPVKFAIEKRKLFVVDNDGKEYVMSITRQVQKQADVSIKSSSLIQTEAN
ncbi:MAG: hypothetical protein K2W82_01050 [Candidatus Obscuribacterales bacterium]|nr:hypothetical protein [Candidatus Obscuribacterales bacterium]